MDRASERLNPILVKEARQSLKSRQFAVTFILLLICGWGWSLLGVALMTPAIYYAPGGRFMLIGYYFVLAFPLIVIVPFAAFRSLASEREDGTYELLSISTLTPRQIVGGKLGSAVLQMLVYLSALSPCVAFTYMLRGVDILLIAFLLIYAFLASLFLSAVGLLLATAVRARHWQVVVSVVLILGLAFAFFFSSIFVAQVVIMGGFLPFDEREFWIAHAALLTGYASCFALVFLAAAARISFKSDNRSTRLRIAMLVQYLLLIGWMTRYVLVVDAEVFLSTFVLLSALHWYVMGVFMTGESPRLSPRVKRRLPKTFFGRVFLTWFFPGPGIGYLYAVAGMCSAVVLTMVAVAWAAVLSVLASLGLSESSLSAGLDRLAGTQGLFSNAGQILLLAVVLFLYVVIYLGIGRVLVRLFAKVAPTGVVMSLLINLIILMLGIMVPIIVQFSLAGVMNGADDYTPLQASNVIWTLIEVFEDDLLDYTVLVGPITCPVIPAILAVTALLVLVVNLIAATAEILPARVPVPARVHEDELLRHPEKAPAPPAPASPWD